jgi:large subunit ribosomal protein L21
MYAVVRAGGKQYRVAPGDVIQVEKTPADSHGRVTFASADVLAVSPEAGQIVKGDGATVTAQVVREGRTPKVLVFKFKRKKQYKKLQGHRQAYTALRITEISFNGKKASAPALEVKKAKAPKAEAAAPQAEKKAAPARSVAHEKAAAHRKEKVAAKKPAAKKAPAKKAAKKK